MDPQIRKRKLEKADILELSVKYMKSLQNSVQGRSGPWRGWGEELVGGGLVESEPCICRQVQEKEAGWRRKLGAVGSWMRGRQQRSGSCGVVIPVEEGSGPREDVRVASPSFPSRLPFPSTCLLSLCLLYNSPVLLPSSTLSSSPRFSRPSRALAGPQQSRVPLGVPRLSAGS